MNGLTVLFTGAGSSMGQSVLKAFLASKYSKESRIIITNSEPGGAGFFLSGLVNACFVVPIAKDPCYSETIEKICLSEGVNVIFSGTEHEISVLSSLKSKFREKYNIHIALSEPNIVDIGTDKMKTWEFFHRFGLPFPQTELLANYKKLVEMCGFPLFMKPRTASASRNVFRIDNEEQLWKFQFAAEDEIILQTYIDSDIEYTVEVYCDKTGAIAGIIPMRRCLEYGLSISGEIDNCMAAIKVSQRVAEALRPQGALNVQLKIVGSEAIPFEINTRFSSTECIRAYYGFNSVEAEIDHYVYNKPINLSNYRTGRFMRYWEECYFSDEAYDTLIETGCLKREQRRSV